MSIKKKIKSTRGAGKRLVKRAVSNAKSLVKTHRANRERKKTDAAVDAHLKRTAEAKKVMAKHNTAREHFGGGNWSPVAGKARYAKKRIRESTKTLKRQLKK